MLNPLQKAAIKHLVAYEFSPPDTRLDHKDFCELVGVSDRTLRFWQKQPEFSAAFQAALAEAEETSDPFALIARQWALEQLMAIYKKAKTSTEKRQILKEVMDKTKHVDTGEVVDYSDYSEEDLLLMCLNRKVSPASMTEEQLKAELVRLKEGEACSTSSEPQS